MKYQIRDIPLLKKVLWAALKGTPPILLLRILIYANWVWTIISVALLIFYLNDATVFGAAFLILQVVVVAILAYLEGRHIYSFNDSGE